MEIICVAGNLFYLALIARILLSWFPIEPGGALAGVFSFVYTITEPVLGPFRRIIPPVNLGGMALDLSVMIVIFAWRFVILAIPGCLPLF